MIKHSPIVVSGSIAIDRIMEFSGRYSDVIKPNNLEHLSVSVLLDRVHDNRGGVGANICYSMALLGEKPHLLGAVGPDGHEYMNDLTSHGVDTSGVYFSKNPTASFTVMTDGEQNQIGGFYAGAMLDSEGLALYEWKEKDPLVVVSPHDTASMRRQVNDCKVWGLRLCYDPGQQVSNLPAEDLAAGIDAAELLFVNEFEMKALVERTGRSVESIKSQVPVVVTTHGDEGSVIDGTKVKSGIRIPVVKPVAVVDPTGAGDAYRAGFLTAYNRGEDLRVCGQIGATCAAYAVEQSGPQGHTFTLDELSKRYTDAFKTPINFK